MVRENSSPSTVYKLLKARAIKNTYAVQINGSYLPATFPKKYEAEYNALRGNCLFYSWTIVDGNYPDADDSRNSWDAMYDIGYRMAMTNQYLDLIKFAAEKYLKIYGQ